MSADGRENVLRSPPGLPLRALAGSAGAKLLEALTLAGLVLLVPRALGAADYGGFAVALAVATGIATATGIGGPALFARVLGPLHGDERDAVARALARRLGAVRCAVVVALVFVAAVAVVFAPGAVSAVQVVLVLVAVAFGTAATLLAQLALGLERIAAWSLRYPLENGVIVVGALALYPAAGLDGAIAAIALGSAASFVLGVVAVGRSLRGLPGSALPAGVLRFARLQGAGGALTQVVHRGAAPACALLGAGAAATGHAAIAAGAALAISYAVMQSTLVVLPGAARTYAGDASRRTSGFAGATAASGRGSGEKRRSSPHRLGGEAAAARGSGAKRPLCRRLAPHPLGALAAPGSATGDAEASLRRVAALAGLVVVPACALLALAAEPLLVAGLGEEFREAAPALRIALVGAALAPLWTLSTQLAALRERPEATLVGAAAGAAMFLAVAAILLPDGGASGAAWAMLAGVCATVAGTLVALRGARTRPEGRTTSEASHSAARPSDGAGSR